MKLEKYINDYRYTLSNEDLKVGDQVYPIANGRSLEDGGWILHDLDFTQFLDEPHIIENLNYSDYKPYQVSTNMGYGPQEKYFKIIKKEKQIKDSSRMFVRFFWKEIGENED